MPGQVFVSCGQATKEERAVSRAVAEWLSSRGFSPYLATQVQTIQDLNGEIIRELKRSDFYLFINFRREGLRQEKGDAEQNPEHRGSLFTNQELAIAYSLGFEKMLFLSQAGVRNEGMLRLMVSNVPQFANYTDALEAVKQAVLSANWNPQYSRNLVVSGLRWGQPVNYRDHTGQRMAQVLYAQITNRRPDIGAMGAVARLGAIVKNGTRRPSPDLSHLKATAYPGYDQTIFPEGDAAFDILALSIAQPTTLFLNSALDVSPRPALLTGPGKYVLEYEVFAQGFPALRFAVEVILERPFTNDAITSARARLSGSSAPFVNSVDSFRAYLRPRA